ncbi:MAG: hypothetical protein IE933_09660 [Sphingomonadales bacterium]|nr:hypothetical protein [Sphingomonadales bacterium]MBD3774696.1 hypothetical protein [Paracoccaceae bacterium]
MSEYPVVHATLGHEQVVAASAEARERLVPSPRFYLVLVGIFFAVAIYGGLALAFLLVQLVPMDLAVFIGPPLTIIVPLVLAVLGLQWANRLYNRSHRKMLAEAMRGYKVPDEIEGTYEILPEGLRLVTARGLFQPAWCSIGEVVPVSDGWVVTSDLGSYFLPGIAFAGAEQEAQFLAGLLAHMTPEAVRRSADARRIAAQTED